MLKELLNIVKLQEIWGKYVFVYIVSVEAKKIISRTSYIILICNSSIKVTNFTRRE